MPLKEETVEINVQSDHMLQQVVGAARSTID